MINRACDYGFNWAFYERDNANFESNDEIIISQQLKYFYERDKKKRGYIKALYLHHLLDFFKETHVNIYDIDLVFEKFLENKAIIEIVDYEGKKVNLKRDLEEIFNLLRNNKRELYEDLKGKYIED